MNQKLMIKGCNMDIEAVKKYLVGLQENICSELEKLDGQGSFMRDEWTKTKGLR
ncbi:MAG: coproporphyrinogen III oxidase, partial [Lentisphaeraceae bacterium]|nr:coproporphyrinogen III oxidase [Lentisphaeraceae bacterium]